MNTLALSSPGRANHSPWREEQSIQRQQTVLSRDLQSDVVIVGGGIAGIATAFFTLRDTDKQVILLEAGRVAGGASGFNAGQLVSYFERPLGELVDTYGFDSAIAAQREIDNAWSLLDSMQQEAAPDLPIQRFVGHMGMWSDNHLAIHLRNNRLRQVGGLKLERCVVSDRVKLGRLRRQYGDLFEIVSQARVQDMLETHNKRYRAVLSFQKGTANSVLLCEQVVAYLQSRYRNRFRVFEDSPVSQIHLDLDGATLSVGELRVDAKKAVLCTNGYQDHSIVNRTGLPIDTSRQQRIQRTIGFMAAFFEPHEEQSAAISYLASPRIGEGQAYYYVTRRPFTHDGQRGSLVCIGGPDRDLDPLVHYNPKQRYGSRVLKQLDDFIRPILQPERHEPLDYQWTWHGIMGYTRNGVRVIGAEPRNPVLLYNLGCNGVGLLPSVYGAARIAKLLAGEPVAVSIFDPSHEQGRHY